MKIRPYKETDAEACCALFLSNVPKYFAPEELAGYQDYLRQHAAGSYWVIDGENGGMAAAGGIHVKDGGVGSLCFGMVDGTLHRTGLGSRMMAYRLLKLLDSPEVTKIRLDTSQHTLPFFGKFGFAVTQVTEDAYGPGLHRHDMELAVPTEAKELRRLKERLVSL